MVQGIVIPAAGRGTRLQDQTQGVMPKALLSIKGIPLVVWNLQVLRQLGVRHIWIVTGPHQKCFDTLKETFGVQVIHHPTWERGNGETLRGGLDVAFREVESVGVLMSDHLYAPSLLKDLVQGDHRGNVLWMDPYWKEIPDLRDAMKVCLDPPMLGKDLLTYQGIDIGLFRLEPRFFPISKEPSMTANMVFLMR